MIQKPTVLILGAGASNPYGYPLGGDLVNIIVSLTSRSGGLAGILADDPGLDDFHTRLQGSDVESIDDFLESNPQFSELGKVCIAAALTVWGPPVSYTLDPNKNWYRYLWGRLHEGASGSQEFQSNRLSIVTYNYDRSLERYLTRVLVSTFPDLAQSGQPAAAAFAAQTIPIVHLHGSLGDADDTVRLTENRGSYITLEFFRSAAAGIRIVHEEKPSEEYARAHDLLSAAQSVHLLGFGYHPTNVRRLDLVKQSQRSTGWTSWGGTALGLEAAERARKEKLVALGGNVLQPVDCLAYLRTFAVLE